MSEKEHVLGERGRDTKLGLRKRSQADVGRREAAKTMKKYSHKAKKMTTITPSQEGEPRGIHNSKKVWLTRPNIYGQGQ